MEKAQFEKAVLSMVHNEGTERLTAANVAYKLGLSVKAAERQLDELVTEGGLELDSDDNGNLFYYVPGVSGGGVFSGVSGVNIDTSDAAGAHYPPKGHHPGDAKSHRPNSSSAHTPYGKDPRDPYAPPSSGGPHAPHGHTAPPQGNYGPGATPWGASYGPKPAPGGPHSHGAPHNTGSPYGHSGAYPPQPPYAPQHPGYPPQQPYSANHGYPPQPPYPPQHQHSYGPQPAPVSPSYAHSPAHSPYSPQQPGYGAPQPQSKGCMGTAVSRPRLHPTVRPPVLSITRRVDMGHVTDRTRTVRSTVTAQRPWSTSHQATCDLRRPRRCSVAFRALDNSTTAKLERRWRSSC